MPGSNHAAQKVGFLGGSLVAQSMFMGSGFRGLGFRKLL